MKSIKLECIFNVIVMVTTLWLPLATGCSPPEGGGFPDPTPEGSVHYATHVVVGKVRAIVTPDPMYPDSFHNEETYGAKVTVQCTYKGPILTGNILVGGAGFIPGHCTSKDLEVATGKQSVILFLREKRDVNGQAVYEQSEVRDLETNLKNYMEVCGLKMNYPEEKGFMLRREVCPQPKNTGICKNYNSNTGDVHVITVPPPTVATRPGHPSPTNSTSKTSGSAAVKDGDGNGSSGLFGSVMMSLFFVIINLAL